ncbi:MAG: hypothetical protein HYZ74_00840 [Elusimicrobia bacterium]|nr:hypothetical protein [Elusimicrobiota bacterium]
MSQPNPSGQSQKKSKKAALQEALLSPPWFPDAKWHVKTLGIIYAILFTIYCGVSYALSTLRKPYHVRHIPMEMTPWLHPGGKVHLPEDQLKAPPGPVDTAAPQK